MKLLSFIYIFALTILCSPGIFIKEKKPIYLLYSLVFAVLFYITFEFIYKNVENYEQYNVDVKGVDSLVNLLKTQDGNNDSKKIDINNNLYQEESADQATCWNSLGKNQKELEIIKTQLDSYAGSKKAIDDLNNKLNAQKKEIDDLENGLKGFTGTKNEIDLINVNIKKYQDEIDKLKTQLELYNQTEQEIGKINKQISALETRITSLNVDITNCTDLNNSKQSNIQTVTNNINNQEGTISSLQNTINNKTGCTVTITSDGSRQKPYCSWSEYGCPEWNSDTQQQCAKMLCMNAGYSSDGAQYVYSTGNMCTTSATDSDVYQWIWGTSMTDLRQVGSRGWLESGITAKCNPK
jgi:cell division septum initiation protein DivIVA